MRSSWHKSQAIIESALERMRLPASYWRHSMPLISQDWMRRAMGGRVRSHWLHDFDALVARLDCETPGWRRQAAAWLAGSPSSQAMSWWRPVAALLGGQTLARPDELIGLVERWGDGPSSETDTGWVDRYRATQCVLALMGTDTTATLSLYRDLLLRLCSDTSWRGAGDGLESAVFIAFIKLLQHRLLSYDEFADAARLGGVFHPDHYSGRRARPPFYQPAVDYLGLSRSRYFRIMYQRLAHEQMNPESAGRWQDIWWLRVLSGQDYFFRALEELERDPASLQALHAAKWSFDFGFRGEDLSRRLSPFSPRTLALVAVLRHDLDHAIGDALDAENYTEAMAWLRGSTQAAWELAVDAPGWLVDWCARWAEAVDDAVEKLWLLGLPPMVSPRLMEAYRDKNDTDHAAAEAERYALVERFVTTHLCPVFTRISLNLDYADGLAGRAEDALIRRAQEDTITSIRALGLPGGDANKRVDALLSLKRRGSRSARAAAEEALSLIARRHGLADAEELERRQELAMAWSDAGLEGRRSKVWWNIGSYLIKLSAAGGRVIVTAYGRRGPLKTIPRAVREHPGFREVTETRRELSQKYAEFRKTLEDSMIAGRVYSASELAMLRSNPVFDNLIERLVLRVGEEALLGSDAVRGDAQVMHPVELLDAGQLDAWQQRIVDGRIVQPFKQCFREVYRPLAEEADAYHSSRFAGHQVLVPRAFALLRSRGYSPGRGEARRDWPRLGLQAHFTWGRDRPKLDYHFGEEGRADPVTTGDIRFARLVDGRPGDPIRIGDVPLIPYSETLRDADLVVSLATAGELGFTSEQTIQFRLALTRQLARILRLHNVAAPGSGSHVVVQGQLATYRVHLGSGSIFIEPTGAHLPCPRPQSQDPQYLPFEDVDSRTAEVLRIIVALSRDDGIADERFHECLAGLGQLTRPD
jgi:hypothetical protein